MLTMVLKMSGLTALYAALTIYLWSYMRGRAMDRRAQWLIGVFFGLCGVAATHFGVDYGQMILNVRNMCPLAAGLFFHPLSGIIAGLICGVERYFVGIWWSVGTHTRLIFGASTVFAGLLTALMSVALYRRSRPTPLHAFCMGAVVEVFHMYAVLITNRNNMSIAYRVIKSCSIPMILFTGIGLALASAGMMMRSGEWRSPFRRTAPEERSVALNFHHWLSAVTLLIFLLNFTGSYAIRTETARQTARDTLLDVAGDICNTYEKITESQRLMMEFSLNEVLADARAIAEAASSAEDEGLPERMRAILGLKSVTLLPEAPETEGAELREDGMIVARVGYSGGTVEVTLSADTVARALNFDGLDAALSYFHVGIKGSFDLITPSGTVFVGNHKGTTVDAPMLSRLNAIDSGTFFTDEWFGQQCLFRVEALADGMRLLLALPESEFYFTRDAQIYEEAFEAILLFASIYVLVTLLMQDMILNNLGRVNAVLSKITEGDLNQVVAVRTSSEFTQLSDHINMTVDALKGYIAAEKKRMERDLALAWSIQDSALPKNFDFARNDFELFALMDPAREVGGDFYDFFFIDQNRLALVIADVSGKGVPAALFMMRGMTALRSLAAAGGSPAEIMARANDALCEGNDAEMFITAWVGIIDLNTGRMVSANAGHEYPALCRAGGDYELLRDRHSLALAAMPGVRYREYELQVNPGDRLFVYTDGVLEAINEATEQYGTDRMVKKLNAMKDRSMADALPALRADIAAFAGSEEQFDDITMLGFVYRGSGKNTPGSA